MVNNAPTILASLLATATPAASLYLRLGRGAYHDFTTKRKRSLLNEPHLPFSPTQIFAAFANPDRLAIWWGPDGFSNTFETFETFEFKAHRRWKFVLHGPDGKDYPNDCVFLEASQLKILIRHVPPQKFTLTIILDETDGQTNLGWHEAFDDPPLAESLAHIIVPANEQNLNRLYMALSTATK